MSIKFYTPEGRIIHYTKVFRTLPLNGTLKRYATLEECQAAAQIEADKTGDWVGVEEWALDGVHDDLNHGWGLINSANPTPDMPTIVLIGGEPRSSCCSETLEVSRGVNDTVTFAPEAWDAATNTLDVRYAKVYPGEADEFEVECSRCHQVIPRLDVNEL